MHVLAAAGTTITTNSLQSWIKDNIIPLLFIIIALSLLGLARKGDNAMAIKVVGGVVIALAVLGLGAGGQADSIGASIWTTVTGL